MTTKEKENWEIEVEENPQIVRIPQPVEKPAKVPNPEPIKA